MTTNRINKYISSSSNMSGVGGGGGLGGGEMDLTSTDPIEVVPIV
jgi:hypothetical protein